MTYTAFTITVVLTGETDRLTGGRMRNSPACNAISGEVNVLIPGAITVSL
jgi:hypothetical protein